jgi:hypothetical protein
MKNTGLKLVHRLQAVDDRTAAGDSMVLSVAQKQELARLPSLSAVAFGAGLAEAVLVGVPANKPEFVGGFVSVSNRDVADRAGVFHAEHRDALERFPICHACRHKCQRPQEAAELLDDQDSTRYRAFSRLLLAWTLGARPDDEATASLTDIAPRADAYCLIAHLLHRYFLDRAEFYRLNPTERATLERGLATAGSMGDGKALSAAEFRSGWLPYLERKKICQQKTCRDCRHPLCYGYEMDRSLAEVELLDQFSRIESGGECQAFLSGVAGEVIGAHCPSLQERLGYCFFIRRYSEIRVQGADAKYNRLMEVFS